MNKNGSYAERKNRRNFIRESVGVLSDNLGHEWIVDLDIFELIKDRLWANNGDGYAVTNLPNRKRLYLHRFIRPEFKIVDHKDRNTFNNIRSNLRDGSGGINILNKDWDTKGTYSKVRGVHKMKNKWQVRLKSRESRVYLGTFSTIGEAQLAIEKYAIETNQQEFYLQ